MKRERSHSTTTYALLTVNIAVYIFLAIKSGDPFEIDRALMERFGFVKELFRAGAYWQLISNMFSHFDITHLGYNMVFLTFFGAKAEELFGGLKTLFFYLAFGMVTTLTAFLYPLGTVSAGASGAIYGLLGADLIAQRGRYPMGTASSILYGFVFFIWAAATGFLAHLVGLIVGFIAGYIVTWDWYSEEGDEESDIVKAMEG